MTSLENSVTQHLVNLLKHVLDEFDVQYTDDKLRKAVTNFNAKPVVKKTPPPKENVKVKTIAPKKKEVEDKHSCEYRNSRGENKNKLCGKNARVEVDGHWYCGTNKEEGVYTGHAKAAYLAFQKRTTNENKNDNKSKVKAAEKNAKKLIEKVAPSNKLQVVRDKKTGRYVHLDTGLVFDKATKKVVGFQDKKGGLQQLTQEQCKLCDDREWQYDPPHVEEEVEEEIEEEEVDDEIEEDELEEVEEEEVEEGDEELEEVDDEEELEEVDEDEVVEEDEEELEEVEEEEELEEVEEVDDEEELEEIEEEDDELEEVDEEDDEEDLEEGDEEDLEELEEGDEEDLEELEEGDEELEEFNEEEIEFE